MPFKCCANFSGSLLLREGNIQIFRTAGMLQLFLLIVDTVWPEARDWAGLFQQLPSFSAGFPIGPPSTHPSSALQCTVKANLCPCRWNSPSHSTTLCWRQRRGPSLCVCSGTTPSREFLSLSHMHPHPCTHISSCIVQLFQISLVAAVIYCDLLINNIVAKLKPSSS